MSSLADGRGTLRARFGGTAPGDDEVWAARIATAFRDADVPLRGVYASRPDGVGRLR